jgi:hypothetical protein
VAVIRALPVSNRRNSSLKGFDMQPFQQRVIEERDELVIKFEKLEKFLESDTSKAIDVDEQRRLIKQSSIMNQYIMILNDRIDNFITEA